MDPVSLQDGGVQDDVAQEAGQGLVVQLPLAEQPELPALRVAATLATEAGGQPLNGPFQLCPREGSEDR